MPFHIRVSSFVLGAFVLACSSPPSSPPTQDAGEDPGGDVLEDADQDDGAGVDATPPLPVEQDAAEDLGPGRCVSVNGAGQILGVDADHVPFIVNLDGQRTSLGSFDGESAVGLVIDDDGVVSGYSESLEGRVAIEYRDGVWQALPDVGSGAAVLALAPDGTRAGFRHGADGLRGFVLEEGGAQRELTLPADRASAIYGLTDDRFVGIVETDRGATHAFVFEAGALVDLETLGGTNSTALAVNAAGDVVGASELADGPVHAFVRWAGEEAIEDLGRHPDAIGSDARGVDDAGRIVLNHQFEDGTTRPQVIERGGAAVDLLPVAGDVPYVSAHVAAVSPGGIAVGWGVPKGGDEHPIRCLAWNLNDVGGQ